MTDGRRDAIAVKCILEFFDDHLRCREVSIAIRPFSRIIRDKIHMCKLPLQEFTEFSCVFETIGDSVDHDILIKHSLVGDADILLDRCHEDIDRIGILDGHDLASCLIVGRME